EVYPAQNRRKLGISPVWCRFKIALCLRLAGEAEAAHSAVRALADSYPEQSLRILGQLESIKDLPESKLFARDVVEIADRPDRARGSSWLSESDDELVPLWQYRFLNPEPYKDPKPSKRRNGVWFDSSNRVSAMPYANRYGPATWVAISSGREGEETVPRAVFLEHYRLRLADAASGLMLREGDGQIEPPVAKENHPRVRIAACDFALLRPIEDESRRYIVIGHESNTTSSKEALKASKLIAYDRSTLQRVWASSDWLDGEDGLRNVIFLAAPTVFGERLLLPSLRRGAYTLECLDRRDGRPLWHTPLHSGGSEFFKAPGCQVQVLGGVAFVATNAGCIAAVDAFAGDLRWIRRYERFDDLHKQVRKKRRNKWGNRMMRGTNSLYPQLPLKSFEPSDLILHEGLLVFAPVDGEVLLALDAASGTPVWTLDGNTRYAPYGKLTGIVGATDELLFATSASHLVCIELDGGLVRWQQELPSWSGPKHSGRGRGTVVGDAVILPNQRELLVFDAHKERPMRRIRLPAFGEGREPLQGSCNVVSHGPWLAVGFQGGVELFSTRAALGELATVTEEPMRKAEYLERSGDARSAELVLANTIRVSSHDAMQREQAGNRLLTLVRVRAFAHARSGDLAAALAAMDEVLPQMTERTVRLNWHLARIELCKAAGDMRAHAIEQERLYDYMEGRG
ncbi:MAG TPA: hypothetical protein ENI87_14425, partial [bacterium]|nr:hypothetical protein [bacterium]